MRQFFVAVSAFCIDLMCEILYIFPSIWLIYFKSKKNKSSCIISDNSVCCRNYGWLRLNKHLFPALALIIVHSIYIRQLMQASAASPVMHICKCKRDVACVRYCPYTALLSRCNTQTLWRLLRSSKKAVAPMPGLKSQCRCHPKRLKLIYQSVTTKEVISAKKYSLDEITHAVGNWAKRV